MQRGNATSGEGAPRRALGARTTYFRRVLGVLGSAALAACGLSVVGPDAATAPDGGSIPRRTDAETNGPVGLPEADSSAPDGASPEDAASGPITHVVTRVGAGQMTQNIGVTGFEGGDFFVAAVTSKPDVAVSSVSGLGLTWQSLASQCSGRSMTGIKLYYARGRALSGSQVSILYATAPLSAAAAVSQLTGAGFVGRTALANTYGAVGECDDGTDRAEVNAAIPAPSPPADAFLLAAVAVRNRTLVYGATLTQLASISAGSSGDVAGLVVLRSTSPVLGGTLSGESDWAAALTELLP